MIHDTPISHVENAQGLRTPDNSRSLPYPFIFRFYSCVYGLAFSRTVYGHPLFVGGNR